MTRATFRGQFTPRAVAIGDKRDPMVRLLQDGEGADGTVEVQYDGQWRTFRRAIRMGLLHPTTNRITLAGAVWLAKHATTAAPAAPRHPAAVALGALGGRAKSAAKTAAARSNGALGGWPKGRPRKVIPSGA